MPAAVPEEWLETDGLGGFAMGTVTGPRTRRYHSLLTIARHPPTDRFNLVPGVEAWIETAAGSFFLALQHYAPDVIAAPGQATVESFEPNPWPRWQIRLPDGTRLEQEVVMHRDHARTLLSWRLLGKGSARLSVRPLLAARDYHSLHHENPSFQMAPAVRGRSLIWQPYSGGPGIVCLANGAFHRQSLWYRSFLYSEERARGLDYLEDLAAPGVFHFDLSAGEAILILSSEPRDEDPVFACRAIRAAETARRAAFPSPLHKSAADFLVKRGEGRTLIAGYPWFTDWGRDTFIAMRGLCIAAGNLPAARDILLDWAPWVSEGMLPNRFPDGGQPPEYNSVDASLWYILAVHDLYAAHDAIDVLLPKHRTALEAATGRILEGYCHGARYGIRMDSDGLLAAGERGVQLTWMDSKIGEWVVTPRIGKPVEIQALWLNALKFAARFSSRWNGPLQAGMESFRRKFWNESCQWLNDVVDIDHQPDRVDSTLRPNQIFALGGLPLVLVPDPQAKAALAAVERHLLTPMGLRTLPETSPDYRQRYEGDPAARDAAYHQGTVWPWLLGPFVEAWLGVRGNDAASRAMARERFLRPLIEHLADAGIGHVSEIADAHAPHTPRGCPAQAWSLGELLRLQKMLAAEEDLATARERPPEPVLRPV